jgi:hypothetical protein
MTVSHKTLRRSILNLREAAVKQTLDLHTKSFPANRRGHPKVPPPTD